MSDHARDVLLVGGGLQSGLIALAVLHARPQTRLTVVESGERLGGNHTWSFHGTDVPSDAEAWLAPLKAHDWQGYDVFFEDFERTLRGSYHSLTGEHLHRVVSERVGQAPHGELILGTRRRRWTPAAPRWTTDAASSRRSSWTAAARPRRR